jgi:hypothetical protein
MKLQPSTKIFLKIKNKKYRIPVNPSEFTLDQRTSDKSENVAGVGGIIIPIKPSPRVASWKSFFPGSSVDPYTNGYKAPSKLSKAILKAWKNRLKCRLVVTRSNGVDVNMRCVITSYKEIEKGGEPGDLYYEIELTEYKSYGAKMMTIVQESVATGPAAEAAGTAGQTTAQAAPEPERPVETAALRVGATGIANGNYYYSSYGAEPHGVANNRSVTVRRIVSGNAYPILIDDLGWIREDQIQITG